MLLLGNFEIKFNVHADNYRIYRQLPYYTNEHLPNADNGIFNKDTKLYKAALCEVNKEIDKYRNSIYKNVWCLHLEIQNIYPLTDFIEV